MFTIHIAELKPASKRPSGAVTGEAHAKQLRQLVAASTVPDGEVVILDFKGIESASASYLKRLLQPFFAPADDPEGFSKELSPAAINVESSDLREDLDDYLAGKGRALIIARSTNKQLKFKDLLGKLDRAASETFYELRDLKKATALQLYGRHGNETSNQTAWNNRLVLLVEMRLARRNREGRTWVYQPTVTK